MRLSVKSLTWFASGVVALGASFAGCSSGGGSGGGGGGFASGLPPVDASGPLQSQLTSVQRDSSYTYTEIQLNNIMGSGGVTALGVAPTGTDTLIAHAPLNRVERTSTNGVVNEESLAARVLDIAVVATSTIASTGDPARAGFGDLYRRTQFGNFGSWAIALDSDRNEARASAVDGSTLWGLIGGEEQTGEIMALDVTAANGSFTTVAIMDSAIPLVAHRYQEDSQVYVGAMDNNLGGGTARLFRMVGNSFNEITLPSQGGGGGIRQEITAILEIGTVSSSGGVASTNSSLLVVAVGAFNRSIGTPVNGYLALTDGSNFEVLATFTQDAPTALAAMDGTIYVGTAAGLLQHRALDGSWVDEPGMPVVNGIKSLLVRDGTTLMIGCNGVNGALLIARGGSGTGGGGGGAVLDRFYINDAKSVIQSQCGTICHSNNAIVAGAMEVSAGMTADMADFNVILAQVDTANPAGSQLLLKATNQVTHTGLDRIKVGDNNYNILLQWIEKGARFDNTSASTRLTYLDDVRPILAVGGVGSCNDCHGAGSGRTFLLSATAGTVADFNAVLAQTNPVTPTLSTMIRKNNGSENHGGGMRLPDGSAVQATIVQWISDGRVFQ